MVEVDSLVKHFGSIKAVDGVSFRVEKGEVLGFLGPNGAGKSTTMKMLTCFIPPTSGEAKVNGHSILDDQIKVREQIGYLPESAPIYEDMTVSAFLSFIAAVRGYSRKDAISRVERVYDICGLRSVRHQAVHTLSKGFRQRVCFAQAIIHDPPVLILDEPTDGLDPNQKQVVRDLINSMAKDKITILSTHILEEMDAVCTRAIIISEGKVKFDGSPDELRSRSEIHNSVVICLPSQDVDRIKAQIRTLGCVKRIEQLNGMESKSHIRLRCYPEKGESIAIPLANLLNEKKLVPEEFVIEKGRLDEVFRNITRKEKNKEDGVETGR